MRAIFGDKAGDVKDSSLRVPPGVEGIVIDTKIFSRRGVEKDPRSLAIEAEAKAKFEKDREDEIEIIQRNSRAKLKEILTGEKLKRNLKDKNSSNILLNTRKSISDEDVDKIPLESWIGADLKLSMDLIERMESIIESYTQKVSKINGLINERIERLSTGDELAPGVIKMVKVYVAVKRKLSVGDKMAGRHGNKGVLSRILPVEDMPYFADGSVIRVNTLKGDAPRLSAASSSRISTADRVVYRITKAWGRQYRTSETIIPVAP